MKKNWLILIAVAFFLSMSCAPVLKTTDIDSWLNTKAGGTPASCDISGKWQDSLEDNQSFLSWGQGEFAQKDNTVTGNINTYVVKGTVSGNTVYLVLYNGNKVQYTAKLEYRNGTELYGSYYKPSDMNQSAPVPMVFKRLN